MRDNALFTSIFGVKKMKNWQRKSLEPLKQTPLTYNYSLHQTAYANRS